MDIVVLMLTSRYEYVLTLKKVIMKDWTIIQENGKWGAVHEMSSIKIPALYNDRKMLKKIINGVTKILIDNGRTRD